MNTTLNLPAVLDARTPNRKDAARPGCQPPPTQTVAEDQRSQVTSAPGRRVRWTILLAGVLALVAGILAAKRINFYQPPVVASYNTRLAELDTKLSRALASQLRAAGYEFDAAIVSVQAPDCQRAVCLVKRLRRGDLTSVTGRMSVRHAGNGSWFFAGMGELTAVQFRVDATAEMRQLRESTPPEFPQAPLAELMVGQSEYQPVCPVGREITILLTATAPGGPRQQWLDLEGLRCLVEPDWDYFSDPRAYLDWCRTNCLDLSVVFDPDQGYWLLAREMAVTPVEGKLWEQATAQGIRSHPALLSSQPPLRSVLSPTHDQTDTYLFRTGEGTFGTLRVLEFDPASRQLKMQYKLARLRAKADT